MSHVYAVLGSGRQGTTAAIRAKASMTDLGGNTELVQQQLLQSPQAVEAAIKTIMAVRGDTPRGVHPAEVAVSPTPYVEELRRRGFALRESLHDR